MSPKSAERFLRDHADHLNEDLALGAGPLVEELAMYNGLSPARLGKFGRLLRLERKPLLALANIARLNGSRAQRFIRHVSQLAGQCESP